MIFNVDKPVQMLTVFIILFEVLIFNIKNSIIASTHLLLSPFGFLERGCMLLKSPFTLLSFITFNILIATTACDVEYLIKLFFFGYVIFANMKLISLNQVSLKCS